MKGNEDPVFLISSPPVPRQAVGSNDCGIHVINFIERIYENPAEFVDRVKSGNLLDFFVSENPTSRRKLRAEIQAMVTQQHKPGGIKDVKDLPALDIPDNVGPNGHGVLVRAYASPLQQVSRVAIQQSGIINPPTTPAQDDVWKAQFINSLPPGFSPSVFGTFLAPKVKSVKKYKRVCSICSQEGHNKTTCKFKK